MPMKSPSRAALRSLRSLLYPSQTHRCLSCSHRLAQSQSPTQAPSQSQSQSQSQQHDNLNSTTHFGFSSIPESEKASRVGNVFTSVAPSYDTMNDLMSLGIHRLWKDYFVRSINPGNPPLPQPPSLSSSSSQRPPPQPQTLLDVAGGTGDIALRLLNHMTHINHDYSSNVIISDINPSMLSAGRQRLSTSNYKDRISYLEADAQSFPTIEDNSIDIYTVAFGIRNFTNPQKALETAYRVLKPGSVFACLEFSKVGGGGMRMLEGVVKGAFGELYKRWSFGVIPLVGQLVAGDRDSYQYLVESIERWHDQATFAGMIEEAGFLVPRAGGLGDGEGEGEGKMWVDLTGGVAAVHKGVKPVR